MPTDLDAIMQGRTLRWESKIEKGFPGRLEQPLRQGLDTTGDDEDGPMRALEDDGEEAEKVKAT